MHLVSTINQLSKSEGNVPVSLFCFNEKLKFIRISEDYEDTIRRVFQAFNIADNTVISLRTSTLDVCKGRDVVIDESAYPLMWTALDQIDVVVEEMVEGMQTQMPESKKARETLPTPATTPTPAQSSSSAGPVQNDYLSAPNVAENAFQKDEDETDQEPNDEPKVTDEEEDIYEPPRPPPGLKTVGDKEESILQKKFKPAASSSASDASPSMTYNDLFPVVKKEKMTQPMPSNIRDVQRPDGNPQKNLKAPPSSDDPRFEITITGPDSLIAQFKTRGKHPIRKVLAAACKTFDIDYERAHLILAVSFEADGRVQTEEFECQPEETMSKCGIDSSSKLFIKVDGENGNDEEADSD